MTFTPNIIAGDVILSCGYTNYIDRVLGYSFRPGEVFAIHTPDADKIADIPGNTYDFAGVASDETYLYVLLSDKVMRVELASGDLSVVDPLMGNLVGLGINPAGTLLAVSDNNATLRLIDLDTFTLNAAEPDVLPTQDVNAIAWVSDTEFFTGGNDCELLKYNSLLEQQAFTRALIPAAASLRYAYQVSASPDGTMIAAAYYHSSAWTDSVVIYDAADGSVVAKTSLTLIRAGSVTWTPDGSRIVYGGYDNSTSAYAIYTLTTAGVETAFPELWSDPGFGNGTCRIGQIIALTNSRALVLNCNASSFERGDTLYHYVIDFLAGEILSDLCPQITTSDSDLWAQFNRAVIIGRGSLADRTITGVVSSSPADRTVRVYHKASGRLLAETVADAETGAFSIPIVNPDPVTVQCVGPDAELSEFYDNVLPA